MCRFAASSSLRADTIWKADVVVFDPDRVEDKATFEKAHQYAVGVQEVVVNGRALVIDGVLTNERSGRILYGPAKQ